LDWYPSISLREGLARLISDFEDEASQPTPTLSAA
jgi:hypothetical protein